MSEHVHPVPVRPRPNTPPKPVRARCAPLGTLLEPGEHVLWTGSPVPWRLAVRRWPFVLVGGPMLCVPMLALRRIVDLNEGTGSRVASWIAMPMLVALALGFGFFVLFGLALVAQPILRVLEARHTLYAISDRRVLIVQSGLLGSPRVHEFRLGEIRRITTIRGWFSGADILLWRGPIDFGMLASSHQQVAANDWRSESGVLGLTDANEPERLIRQLHLAPDVPS